MEVAKEISSVSVEEPIPDPIIRSILDSRKLTFEDETAIRHQVTLSSRKKTNFVSFIPAAATAVLGTIGGFLSFRDVFSTSKTLHNPTLGRVCSVGAAVGGIGLIAKELCGRCLSREVNEFLELLHDTSSLARKISRWILDNEVLQRGYAVSTTRDQNPRGNVLSLRACLRLRRSAFIESRFMVFILRAVAVDMLKTSGPQDPLDNHICLIPLEEFGDSLSIPEGNLEALYLSTDGFSLQATKSLVGLLDLQVSEFLKLLCMCRLNPTAIFSDLLLYRRLKKAHTLFLEAFKRMEMEYKFETDEPGSASSLRRQSTLSNSGNPPDYLRSLELHLTAALKDLRIVINNDTDGIQDGNELQKIGQQDRLEKLGYHVKCSTMLLDHIKQKSLMDDQTPSADDPEEISPSVSDFELKPVTKAEDVVHVEDEIFEALIMDDATAEHRGEPVFSEMNHYQEQKQQSKMILEEIKTLLSTRSANWKERERIAREKKGLPLDDLDSLPDDCQVVPTRIPVISVDSADEVILRGHFSTDIATIAAAVGSSWQGRAEDQFGSDESDAEEK